MVTEFVDRVDRRKIRGNYQGVQKKIGKLTRFMALLFM